ncbi:hypothetical protein [Undibacterium aquatile]|uniref:hypothetical protein n=1 Tax=Undibacterium aquatile TaxID=1537398 RepID=UPI0036F289F4
MSNSSGWTFAFAKVLLLGGRNLDGPASVTLFGAGDVVHPDIAKMRMKTGLKASRRCKGESLNMEVTSPGTIDGHQHTTDCPAIG